MDAMDDLIGCISAVLKRRIPNLTLGGFSDTPRLTDEEAKEAIAMWMGRKRSEKKAAASRENGRKGGRPRKNRKYELTDDVIVVDGHAMHRIKATRQVGLWVKPGELGGYIESEANLSHEGDAWVGGEARVYGEARVLDQADVCDNAIVRDKATVRGFAQVSENSIVCGEAWVGGNALVRGRAVVCGNATVLAHDNVFGDQIRHRGISREEYEAIKAEQSGRRTTNGRPKEPPC